MVANAETILLKTETTNTIPQDKLIIVWRNVLLFTYLHLAALYGCFLIFTFQLSPLTYIWIVFIGFLNIQGIVPGAHRLWTHRCYKAKFPLRVYLMCCNCLAFQNHIYEWARDHRVHHKFSETNADPHNAKRGFFFAHMGWLLCRKHPDVLKKGQTIDMSDLLRDPVVVFQKKYYIPLVVFWSLVFPSIVPWYLWGENGYNAFIVCSITRLTLALHSTWLVNSAAHLWGDKPYDKNINPAENMIVSFLTSGEGFHNYHHTFPWDFRASEWGGVRLNWSTSIIKVWEKLGWAYDLKVVPNDVINKRRARKGDDSMPWYPDIYEENTRNYKINKE